jgi:hypothetical protein
LDVQSLHHAGEALVHMVLLTIEHRCLIHKALVDFCLKADEVDPICLLHSDRWKILQLTHIECSKKGMLR